MKKLLKFLLTAVTLIIFQQNSVSQNTYPWPSTGNIGIGTTENTELLQVGSSLLRGLNIRVGERATLGLTFEHAETVIGNNAKVVGNKVMALLPIKDGASAITMNYKSGIHFYITSEATGSAYQINSPALEKMRITPKDGVFAEQVTVVAQSLWPDYVFSKSYSLKSLEFLEDFINTNHHLPNIPSAENVKTDGINLGEMDAKLLEKIEELTLYVIEQNKRLEKVMEENKELKEKVGLLESKIK